MPLAPEEGVDIVVGKAFDGGGHLALKGDSSHLAIGDDLQPHFFLERHRRVHGSLFDVLELRRAQCAGGEGLSGFEKLRRAKQAPDDISM